MCLTIGPMQVIISTYQIKVSMTQQETYKTKLWFKITNSDWKTKHIQGKKESWHDWLRGGGVEHQVCELHSVHYLEMSVKERNTSSWPHARCRMKMSGFSSMKITTQIKWKLWILTTTGWWWWWFERKKSWQRMQTMKQLLEFDELITKLLAGDFNYLIYLPSANWSITKIKYLLVRSFLRLTPN